MANKAYYQKRIIDLRLQISRERDAKKRDNASYASLIKGTSVASSKASYRKAKVEKSEYHTRQIERLKQEVARMQLEKAKAPR